MLDTLNDYPDLLTVPEVATLLGVDPSYVYRLSRDGRMPVLRRTPHTTRVAKADLRRFLEAAHPVAAAPLAWSMHATASRTWREHDA